MGAPEEERDALGRSLPDWQPFREVPAALEEARGRGWKLVILSNTDREFIEASRSVGATNWGILFRELLPNLVAPIIVYASILVPQVILYEAALSFLGVGITDQSSWGQMISDATTIFSDAWWYMTFPGVALLLTVLAFNLVGDAMQDALNPRAKRN